MGAPRRAVATALTVLLLAACGTSRIDELPPTEVGGARSVTVLGELSESDAAAIEWALGRFELAGLQLPPVIEFAFDRTRTSCGSVPGTCRPSGEIPRVTICQQSGTFAQSLKQRITLLHELAHVWHFAQGDGTSWPDRSEIVGGVTGAGPDDDVAWADRTEERVAVAVTWGLLDQRRRPVRSGLPCWVLYSQFVQLTGVRPLEPIEPVCRTSGAPGAAWGTAAHVIAVDWSDEATQRPDE